MKRVKKYSLLCLFYISFVLFMLHRLFFFIPGFLEKTTSYVVYPFVKTKQVIQYPFERISQYFQDVAVLQKRIASLEDERSELQLQLTRQQALQTFDEQSKDVIEFASRYKHNQKLLAHILLTTSGAAEDTIVLDVGQRQGVCKDHVAVYRDMIIGRVVEVYPWYCKVALITDQRCKIAAQCKKGVSGICCGKNSGQIELNYVPHFKDVQIDDLIVSTGKGLIYPKGFALGRVTSITSDNVSHFIQAKPLFDITKIDYVYIFVK